MKQTIITYLEQPCYFANWYFDPADGQLRSKKEQLRLQPRLSKLLSIFIANKDVLLAREELINILWQDKSVNEDALSRCIAELRSMLGDNISVPIYIETIPKKGYRFIQPLVTNKSNNIIYGSMVLSIFFIAAIFLINLFTSKDPTNELKSALIAAKRITINSELEHQPALSNKGDKIAFTVMQNKRLIIKIISKEGELLHEIKDLNQHLQSPTFSNDDQSLLIAAHEQEKCTIFQYLLPSMQRKSLGSCRIPNLSTIFDWSPDGKRFAYVAAKKKPTQEKKSNNTAIWEYDLSTKQRTQLSDPKGINVFDTQPKFSPDGKQLSFTRGTSSVRNIYVADFDILMKAKPLTKSREFVTSFDWLNDNQHIIFDSNRLGDRNLWLLNTMTNQQQLLGARDARFLSIDNENRFLVFQEIRYNANIWSVDLDNNPSSPNRIIQSIKYNNFPAFSPDGKQIAFVSNRKGRATVWLYSIETKQQNILLDIPELDLIHPSWSEDGKQLLVSSRGSEGYRCYQVDLATSEHYPITLIKQAHYGCVFSEQGDIFAVSRDQSKQNYLLKLNVDGKVQQLTQFGVGRIQVTNFDTIIYSLSNKDGLYSMDFNGQENKTILATFKHSLDGYWTVQDSYLYYPKFDDDKGIWRKDLLTDKEEKVTTELPSAIGVVISVKPDHSQLVLSLTDQVEADLYLSDLKLLSD